MLRSTSLRRLAHGWISALLLTSVLAAPKNPETFEEWIARKPAFRQQWLEILGPFPERSPLNAKVVSTHEEPDHVRKLVHYQVEPGIQTDAFLLIPKNLDAPAPAAVVFHGTTSNHILTPVGLTDRPTRHLALAMVRRGYVTLSPRCFIFGTANTSATTAPATPPTNFASYNRAASELLERQPEWTGMGKMLWDGMRAVDYLETLPEVDITRIVTVGHSLGAKEALYLVAFDDRVKGAISSEGGVGIAQSNWDAPWYLGKRTPDPAVRDHDDLLRLAAPRPVIVLGGESSDGTHSAKIMDRARPLYELYGKPDALILQLHSAGHDFPFAERDKALDTLERALKSGK